MARGVEVPQCLRRRRICPMLPMLMTTTLRLTRIGRRWTSSLISGERAALDRRCQGRHHTSLCLKGEVPMMVCVCGHRKGMWDGLRRGALELRCPAVKV
jgi:hypothetical protein